MGRNLAPPVAVVLEFRLDPRYAAGRSFTVVAHDNAPGNVYIRRALLNGREYDASHLDFAQIAAGGTPELFLAPEPNPGWGLAGTMAPAAPRQ